MARLKKTTCWLSLWISVFCIIASCDLKADTTSNQLTDTVDSRYICFGGIYVSLGWGEYTQDLGRTFKRYRDLKIGLSLRVWNIGLNASGAWAGARFYRDYPRIIYSDRISYTTVFPVMNTSINLEYQLKKLKRFGFNIILGVKWNSFKSFALTEPPPWIGYKRGYFFATRPTFMVRQTAPSNKGHKTYQYLFLEFSLGRWYFSEIGLGNGNLMTVSFGYKVETAIF